MIRILLKTDKKNLIINCNDVKICKGYFIILTDLHSYKLNYSQFDFEILLSR